MRKLFAILFILCLTANITFAAPNYDPNKKWVNYDDSYNVELWNKLNKQYRNKHFLYEEVDKDGNIITHFSSGDYDYNHEVIIPYNHLKINTNPAYY